MCTKGQNKSWQSTRSWTSTEKDIGQLIESTG